MLELVGYPGICEGPASRVAFLAGAPGLGITVNQPCHHSRRDAAVFYDSER